MITGRLDERVADRIVAETRGNPLALLELPRGLSPAELANVCVPRTLSPPHDVRTGPFASAKLAAYCEEMRVVMEPVNERAREAFARCAELGQTDHWQATCVHALEALDPEAFPALRELLPPLASTPDKNRSRTRTRARGKGTRAI